MTGWNELETGPLVVHSDHSNGGMLLDATGDGTADDVMVFNQGPNAGTSQPNEVLVFDASAGTFEAMTTGPLVARSGSSGMVLDATGDGIADDVMVFNDDDLCYGPNGVLLWRDCSDGFFSIPERSSFCCALHITTARPNFTDYLMLAPAKS